MRSTTRFTTEIWRDLFFSLVYLNLPDVEKTSENTMSKLWSLPSYRPHSLRPWTAGFGNSSSNLIWEATACYSILGIVYLFFLSLEIPTRTNRSTLKILAVFLYPSATVMHTKVHDHSWTLQSKEWNTQHSLWVSLRLSSLTL